MQGAAPVFSRALTCSQLLMSHRMGQSNTFQCTWYKFPNLSRTLAYQSISLCFLTVWSFNSLFFQVAECSHSSPHKYSTTLPATQDTWWQDGLCFSFLQNHHFSLSYFLVYGGTTSIYYFWVWKNLKRHPPPWYYLNNVVKEYRPRMQRRQEEKWNYTLEIHHSSCVKQPA